MPVRHLPPEKRVKRVGRRKPRRPAQEIARDPATTPDKRASVLTELKRFADTGSITQDTYFQVSKYFSPSGAPLPEFTTQKATVEKTDTGNITTYTTVTTDSAGNFISAQSSQTPSAAIGQSLLLTAVNKSETQDGQNALAQLKKNYPDLVSLANTAIAARERDALQQAVALQNAGSTAHAVLKTYTLTDLIGNNYFVNPTIGPQEVVVNQPIYQGRGGLLAIKQTVVSVPKNYSSLTPEDLNSVLCATDPNCFAQKTLAQNANAPGGSVLNLLNTFSFGNNQEFARLLTSSIDLSL